jgi:hypothetical protein
MISLRSFLESDNKKLWQAVLELSIETAALRRALKTKKSRGRAASVKPAPARRSPRSRIAALASPEAEPHVLPFSR